MSMRKVYLELTDGCNLNCTICYRRTWNIPTISMDEADLNKIFHMLKSISTMKEVVIGGIGEPTLSPLFSQTVEALRDYHITVTTNGTLLSDSIANSIVKYVNVVTISVDGMDNSFKNIRGISLDTIVKNIEKINLLKKELNSALPNIHIQFVASSDNIKDVFKVIDLASDMNASKVIISNYLPQQEDKAASILYTRYENKEMKTLFNQLRNYSFRKGLQLLLPNYEIKTERRCSFIDDSAAFITASGDVVPCYRLSHYSKEYVFGRPKQVFKHSFGSIHEESLDQIWNSRKYAAFRDAIYNNLYPSCIDCDLVEGCDMARDTESDCYGVSPSCGDCLWTRKFVICP